VAVGSVSFEAEDDLRFSTPVGGRGEGMKGWDKGRLGDWHDRESTTA
jgi:hypothetical protein